MNQGRDAAHSLYRELEHTADFGVEIRAPTRSELFRRAALALAALLVESAEIRATTVREAAITAADDIALMHDMLTELLQLFAADEFIWGDAEVKSDGRALRVLLHGEAFDPAQHRPRTEIKGVTYHQLIVEKTAHEWLTRVIFDV